MQGACEGPGVQVAAGRAGDRGQAQSHLQSLLGARNRRAALEEPGSVGSAKQNKQCLRLKSSKGVGITIPNLCICFCCSQSMTGSSQRWEVSEITGPC